MLFLPLVFSYKFLSPRIGFEYTSLFHFAQTANPISNFLLYPWGNFDGVYYLFIAKAGYTVDNAGFFPLYPLLIRIFSLGESSIQFYVGLILSSLFFVISLIYFYKLLKIDYKTDLTFLPILYILIFPTSFFFASIYTESLFFLLLILSFYFARKKKWFLSSLFGILLTATRIVGIAVWPALILEFYLQNKKILSKKAVPLIFVPLGLLAFSVFNLINLGNALQFIKVQGNLLNNRAVGEIVLFPQTIFRYFKILTVISPSVYEWKVALLELSSFVFASLLLYVAWRKKVRLSYLLFAVIALLIPASTGTFTGLPRYILPLFPMFIALALIKNKFIRTIYIVVSIVLLFILFALFSKGYFVS